MVAAILTKPARHIREIYVHIARRPEPVKIMWPEHQQRQKNIKKTTNRCTQGTQSQNGQNVCCCRRMLCLHSSRCLELHLFPIWKWAECFAFAISRICQCPGPGQWWWLLGCLSHKKKKKRSVNVIVSQWAAFNYLLMLQPVVFAYITISVYVIVVRVGCWVSGS